MTADLEVRARRRLLELNEKGLNSNYESVYSNLAERDSMDEGRSDSPLKKANDAITIDTTELNFKEQVNMVLNRAKQLIGIT